jgi:hypothetical protein
MACGTVIPKYLPVQRGALEPRPFRVRQRIEAKHFHLRRSMKAVTVIGGVRISRQSFHNNLLIDLVR